MKIQSKLFGKYNLLLRCVVFLGLVELRTTGAITQIRSEEKTILITGGAGFIGSNFLEYCFHKYPSYKFLVLDALTYAGSLDNISSDIFSSPRFTFVYGSVNNSRLVDSLMSQADFVVHFAAESHVTRSIQDSSVFFDTDVIGTRVLMDSLIRHNNVERFIHISTSEVLGTAEIVPMTEQHPINPRTPYAAAKAAADRLVYAYQCTYDIPSVIVRPFNNYGPRQHLEKMIPRFITNVLTGRPVIIHGDGLQTRDWLHVTDTCRALDMILHYEEFNHIKHSVINIGSGRETSILDIAKAVLKIFNVPVNNEYMIFMADRPGQISRHIASIDMAKRLIGWEPSIPLETGLKSVVAWYRSNESWWKSRQHMQSVEIVRGEHRVIM